eukprot:2905902-Alexandrium_andersonii.AAC.1
MYVLIVGCAFDYFVNRCSYLDSHRQRCRGLGKDVVPRRGSPLLVAELLAVFANWLYVARAAASL